MLPSILFGFYTTLGSFGALLAIAPAIGAGALALRLLRRRRDYRLELELARDELKCAYDELARLRSKRRRRRSR